MTVLHVPCSQTAMDEVSSSLDQALDVLRHREQKHNSTALEYTPNLKPSNPKPTSETLKPRKKKGLEFGILGFRVWG